MAHYFLDTSALVKLYIQEAGSEAMLRRVTAGVNQITVVAVARVEFHAAIRRRCADQSLTTEDAEAILGELQEHWDSYYIIQPVTEALLSVAVRLLTIYPLKAYDAIQLAACIVLAQSSDPAPTFVSADRTLLRLAEQEGIGSWNPETE